MLSPDETLLYISNSQGDALTAALFDASTGKLSSGCTSPLSEIMFHRFRMWHHWRSKARWEMAGWYTRRVRRAAVVNRDVQVGSSGGKCTLTELSGSPVADANSSGLLSIAGFPPRPF